MVAIEETHKVLETAEYIKNYRDAEKFLGFCERCENHNKVWGCPPYNYNPLDRVCQYRYIHLWGYKVLLDKATREKPVPPQEIEQLSRSIMIKVRKDIDNKLLRLERENSGSLAFFAGSCILCPRGECQRGKNLPCLYPDKARTSLEAYGFDIVRTASELLKIKILWSDNNIPPEYFTFVCALFTELPITQHQIPMQHKEE